MDYFKEVELINNLGIYGSPIWKNKSYTIEIENSNKWSYKIFYIFLFIILIVFSSYIVYKTNTSYLDIFLNKYIYGTIIGIVALTYLIKLFFSSKIVLNNEKKELDYNGLIYNFSDIVSIDKRFEMHLNERSTTDVYIKLNDGREIVLFKSYNEGNAVSVLKVISIILKINK